MLGMGTVLHQHDIHVNHNGLEKVSGNAGAVHLERLSVTEKFGGVESNQRSDIEVGSLGDATSGAGVYVRILVNYRADSHGGIMYERPDDSSPDCAASRSNRFVRSCTTTLAASGVRIPGRVFGRFLLCDTKLSIDSLVVLESIRFR